MRRTSTGLALTAACLLALGAVQASTVIGLTIEDQARLSKHVVVGEVVSQQGIDDPQNGLETAVTLRVLLTLKGDALSGQDLVFHTRSGELDGEISTAVGEADLKTGQRILVFVEEVDGRLYNLGLSYGVFNVIESSQNRASFVRAIQDGLEIAADAGVGNGPFTLEDVKSRVDFAARHPRFDNPIVQETFGKGR